MRILTNKTGGFTLLEVLIALSIFSLIGLASYRLLDVVIVTQGKVESHQNQIRALERAMHIIGNDFEQLIERPIRDNYGDTLPALATQQENYLLELTRQGWRNPLQLPRSQLQRVAYELGSNKSSSVNSSEGNNNSNNPNRISQQDDSGVHLLRHYWPVLDRPQDSEPLTQVLIRNVNDVQLLFMDQQGNWQTQWPAETVIGEANMTLPNALMLKLDVASIGKLARVYQLTEFSAELSKLKASNTTNNNAIDVDEDDSAPTHQPLTQPLNHFWTPE